MEQSEFVEPTLRIYERLRAAGHANVGSSCRHTCTGLRPISSGCSRSRPTCASSRAHTSSPRRSPIRRSETWTPRTFAWWSALEGAGHVAVATHDERIIRHARALAAREGIERDRFEFQMLYGVRPGLQRTLVA